MKIWRKVLKNLADARSFPLHSINFVALSQARCTKVQYSPAIRKAKKLQSVLNYTTTSYLPNLDKANYVDIQVELTMRSINQIADSSPTLASQAASITSEAVFCGRGSLKYGRIFGKFDQTHILYW